MRSRHLVLSLALATIGCAITTTPSGDAAAGDASSMLDTGVSNGPLRLEILDPVPDQVLSCVIEAANPTMCAATYRVRARVSGTGAADLQMLELTSTGLAGTSSAALVDGPDGRVAEGSILVGRAPLGSGRMGASIGVHAGEGPAAPSASVTVAVDFR